MKLSIVLFCIVVGRFVGFFRDSFQLPLYNNRTEIIEMIILSISILLISKSQGWLKPSGSEEAHRENLFKGKAFGNKIYFNKFAVLFVFTGFLILIVSSHNVSPNYLVSLQAMIFALCLTVASVAYKDWNKYLLKSLSFSIIFITFLLVFVFLFRNLLTITNAPDLMSRNGWAASSVLYLVIFHQKNRLLKYSGFFLVCCIIAWITGSKLAMLFLLLSLFCRLFHTDFKTTFKFNLFVLIAINSIIIALPYVSLDLVNISFKEVKYLGAYRYFIDDNIESLVSRVFSVRHLIDNGSLFEFFGNGEIYSVEDKFWGYPVHNLLLFFSYSHGIFGTFLYLVIMIFFAYYSRSLLQIIFCALASVYFNDLMCFWVVLIIGYRLQEHAKINRRLNAPS